MLDKLSIRYADFMDSTYDCVDRIVLNAYFQFGQTPGGFRLWWRSQEGSDENLDNVHLMRMAGRFARRVRVHAKAHQITVVDCATAERKHEIAEQYLPKDPGFIGVFVILVGRAPAPVWGIQQSKSGKIVNLERKTQYVNHYYFHLLDPDWGHVTIRICGHPPFGVQVILNGHEYVVCQAGKAGISFQKEDNCFTNVANACQLAQIAYTLRSPSVIGQLEQVCERWIYSAYLCFALDLQEQERTRFHYGYSIYQAKYSHNLLFHHVSQMEQIFQSLVDQTRAWLDVKRVHTIFGYKRRPFLHRKSSSQPRFEVVVKKSRYDLTVFKLHFGKLMVKLYTKGERVLRGEAIIHNARALHSGRSLPKFTDILAELEQILLRFLEALDYVDNSFIGDDHFENLSQPGQVGKTRVAGSDLNKPHIRAVLQAILTLAASPTGFLVSALVGKVQEILNLEEEAYKPRYASYGLKKLRGKNWVCSIGKSHRYQVISDSLREMTALLVLREKVVKPVLAGAKQAIPPFELSRTTTLDTLYRTLQEDLLNLFQVIGISVQMV